MHIAKTHLENRLLQEKWNDIRAWFGYDLHHEYRTWGFTFERFKRMDLLYCHQYFNHVTFNCNKHQLVCIMFISDAGKSRAGLLFSGTSTLKW